MCVYKLCATLNTENVCQRLMFAEIHHIVELKQEAYKFIFQNRQVIMSSNGWHQIANEYPELLHEYTQMMANSIPAAEQTRPS